MSAGPIIVSLGAVGIGAALGLLRGPAGGWLQPIRTFGLVSVLGLILVLLLPEAVSGLGILAIAVIGAGYAIPAFLDRMENKLRDSTKSRRLGAELGFIVVLVHQFCDGLALASESAHVHGIEHWDALVAMSVHTIPLTTLVVVSFGLWRGPGAAVLRALAIALATLAGVATVQAFPVAQLTALHPWLAAAVSGMLLHIMAEGPRPTLESKADRGRDALATLAGVVLIGIGVMGAHSHSEAGAAFSEQVLASFASMSLTTAPALLLGLSAGAAIAAFGAPVPTRWLASPRSGLDAIRGALIGTPLPVCSCGVLPVAQGLRGRGASSGFILAFLVATPEIGIDAFALSTQFLGWQLSIIRVVTALILAISAGVIGAAIMRRQRPATVAAPASTCCKHSDGPEKEQDAEAGRQTLTTRWQSFLSELDDLVFHIGPWTLLGLVVAAYAETVLPSGSWASTQSGVDIFVVTLLAIPSYVCAASMTPLAAVLLFKGFSAGAVLAGLLLGPATNIATFAFVRGELGKRGVLVWTAAIIAVTWTMALGINAMDSAGLIAPPPASAMAHEHGAPWYSLLAAWILIVLIGRGIWRVGFGRWIASLGGFMNFVARRPSNA